MYILIKLEEKKNVTKIMDKFKKVTFFVFVYKKKIINYYYFFCGFRNISIVPVVNDFLLIKHLFLKKENHQYLRLN
jgi:hypothetical protein